MGDRLRQRIRQNKEIADPVQDALLNLLVAAGHLREQLERVCSAHGLSQSQYNVLRILRGVYPDGHARCAIIERMIERAPDVTRLIDRLERDGLVERDSSEEDRRLSIARITPRGLTLLERMEPDFEAVHTFFAHRVSERDRAHLSRICEGIYSDD